MRRYLLHQQLLERVAEKLASTAITTDRLLLICWQAVGICQFLLQGTSREAEQQGIQALEIFVDAGAVQSVAEALRRASSDLRKIRNQNNVSILASIVPEQRQEILRSIHEDDINGDKIIAQALEVVPSLRQRFQNLPEILIAGPRHRFELLATLAADVGSPESDRRLAGATLTHLSKFQNDSSVPVNLLEVIDDDLTVRVMLDALDQYSKNDKLHWTGRIADLWDELPFFQGVQLTNGDRSMAATWLDRVNSYVSCEHILSRQQAPLILVQPSVACEPLYSIVSLIGLLVLDGLTISQNLIGSLRSGQVYEVDGKYHCRYDGVTGPIPGWLRLVFRDGAIYCPPTVARRMVPTTASKLARAKEFSAVTTPHATEPIQRFFNWPEAIGVAAVSARVLFVSSHQRAMEVFADVASNGIELFDGGLISFYGAASNPTLSYGTPIVVVPTLTVARQLVDKGENVHAIVVDGYERLKRGRHDLPFLLTSRSRPPIVVWSQKGYFPAQSPSWLAKHRELTLSSEDISSLLKLDADLSPELAPSLKSLSFAGAPRLERSVVVPTEAEKSAAASIKEFIEAISHSSEVPDYWKYHLLSIVTELRAIVEATPAY